MLVNSTLNELENELNQISQACERHKVSKELTCSQCICEYRNVIINETISKLEESIKSNKADFTSNLDEYIKDTILPWKEEHLCAENKNSSSKLDMSICDLSVMNLITPGEDVTLNCNFTFVCDTIIVDTTIFKIHTDKIYVGPGATIKNVPPSKAENGKNAIHLGYHGSNGAPGTPAFNMILHANSLLRESDKELIFTSQGGEGGNGGNGMKGKSHLNEIPANPANAKAVYDQGIQDPGKPHTSHCSDHCGSQCDTCDEYWYRVVDINTNACGENGGDGGDGGNGGPLGKLIITGYIYRREKYFTHPISKAL